MTIDIVGAGIGGLTTALALETKGIKTRIFEQSKELRPIGAGIILANNAMQVLDRLGLKSELEAAGNPISTLSVTDHLLQPISAADLGYFEKKYGVRNVAIHRGQLQQILASHIKGNLLLDHELCDIKSADQGIELQFNENKSVLSQTVIGADGINSKVRQKFLDQGIKRSSGQICWRGVVEYTLPKKHLHEVNEAWGHGRRVGFVQIDDRLVYWFAVMDEGDYNESSDESLASYFEGFHPMVMELLSATQKASIHEAILEDLQPLKVWYRDHVCLIGDAAHATTPNLGQGACQAIEDAYTIADCLDHKEPTHAFRSFQEKRIKKAHKIVNTRWQIGKLAHWKNPLAVTIRNRIMRSIPSSINRKQSERIFALHLN